MFVIRMHSRYNVKDIMYNLKIGTIRTKYSIIYYVLVYEAHTYAKPMPVFTLCNKHQM